MKVTSKKTNIYRKLVDEKFCFSRKLRWPIFMEAIGLYLRAPLLLFSPSLSLSLSLSLFLCLSHSLSLCRVYLNVEEHTTNFHKKMLGIYKKIANLACFLVYYKIVSQICHRDSWHQDTSAGYLSHRHCLNLRVTFVVTVPKSLFYYFCTVFKV